MKKKYLIVIADYYKGISKGLLKTSMDLLPKTSIIKIINVPGVFEIPVTISKNIKLEFTRIYLMAQSILL